MRPTTIIDVSFSELMSPPQIKVDRIKVVCVISVQTAHILSCRILLGREMVYRQIVLLDCKWCFPFVSSVSPKLESSGHGNGFRNSQKGKVSIWVGVWLWVKVTHPTN